MDSRLIKKSIWISDDNEVVEFIRLWYTSWDKDAHGGQINEILSNNPNCVYSGEAYRYIGLRSNISESDIDLDDDREVENFIEELESDLLPIVSYSSFSVSKDAIYDFVRNSDHELERTGLIISTTISNGLDFERLAEIHLDDEDDRELLNLIKDEQEIISTSQIDISQCKIIGFAIDSEVIWIR